MYAVVVVAEHAPSGELTSVSAPTLLLFLGKIRCRSSSVLIPDDPKTSPSDLRFFLESSRRRKGGDLQC